MDAPAPEAAPQRPTPKRSPRLPSLSHALALPALLLGLAASCTKPRPPPGEVSFELAYELPSTCGEITLAARHDALDRPYLYVVAKEGGLRIYEHSSASSSAAPKQVAQLPSAQLGGLHAMNLSQHGSLLFVALGNTFGTAVQHAGMAIVDVSAPASPVLRSLWEDPALPGGTGIVASDGPYAYLGAMGNGLIVFDVRDPAQPALLSRFVPPLDFPEARYDEKKINARGLEVAGDLLYLAYDAGGLRIVDVSDRSQPREVGRYANPALNGKPRAYNNVVTWKVPTSSSSGDRTLAYVGVDYCGVEVLDVTRPEKPTLAAWWNPWACEKSALNWFTSDGHANEVALDEAAQLLFVSSGKSDLQVLDLADPTHPVKAAEYGGVDNGIGTWGVSRHGDELLLTYTCAVVPFTSSWTGVKALRYAR